MNVQEHTQGGGLASQWKLIGINMEVEWHVIMICVLIFRRKSFQALQVTHADSLAEPPFPSIFKS
eukprot:4689011-Amphidinium_carterae.1